MSEVHNQLAEQISECVSELQLIRDVLEELRVDFEWAIHNDKVQNRHCDYISEASSKIESAANAILKLPEAFNDVVGSIECQQIETSLRPHSNDISKSSSSSPHMGEQQELF